MRVIADGQYSTVIEDRVIKRVLGMYPEEYLIDRPVFRNAFATGHIEYSELLDESQKILIPWQMYFLTSANLDTQIAHINENRKYKISPKLFSKRRGSGNVTSIRIIDRLIRQQNYLTTAASFPKNVFCGSLRNTKTSQAVNHMISHFNINRSELWRIKSKNQALKYLINQVEAQNINISRGVLTNKILPNWRVVHSDVYHSTSGFVIRDDYVPFVFLPSEINPDEVESRQIYTLIYLLAIIGLEQYDYYLDKDFNERMLSDTGVSAKLHKITTELLIPTSEIIQLREQDITDEMRDSLSKKFKVSPTALVVTLLKRQIITKQQYQALLPPPYVRQKTRRKARNPRVSTSVKKFCGQISYDVINGGIQSGGLSSVQAQYLIWGAIYKKGYRKYRSELGL